MSSFEEMSFQILVRHRMKEVIHVFAQSSVIQWEAIGAFELLVASSFSQALLCSAENFRRLFESTAGADPNSSMERHLICRFHRLFALCCCCCNRLPPAAVVLSNSVMLFTS